MEIKPNRIDAAGQIVGFGFHDSVVEGFTFQTQASLTLALRRPDGSRVALVLEKIDEVRGIHFCLPAIISEVFAWPPAETPPAAESFTDGAWRVFFSNDLSGPALHEAVNRVVRDCKFKYLVLVSCSYGGPFAVMCDAMSVVENPGEF